ncbi:MAG: glycosyltransferase family 2 protein [Bacteroidaceae bacterium]|nr:glycosyltransferase family 2 protein [Bacteroidaceae bacterium]
MKEPNISIAMTTYNGSRYLREQLDSLYRQTVNPFEIVVCDDGSTDGTVAILQEYQSKGLRLYVNDSNKGYNDNFYQAISLCQGDYIALCDQDDVWLEDKLAKTYAAMQQNENGPTLISTQVIDVDANLVPLPNAQQSRHSYANIPINTIVFTGNSQGCTLMMNRAMVDYLMPVVKAHQDLRECIEYDAVIGIVAASACTKINLPDVTLLYRRHDHNAIGKAERPQYTFKQLISLRPYYHHLMIDQRLDALEVIYRYFESDMSDEVKSYYHTLYKMNHASTFFAGMRYMFKLPIPLSKKLEVLFYSTTNHILRKLSHCL